MSFYPAQGHRQSQSYYSKNSSNFPKQQAQIVIQNSRLKLLDAFCKDKENDIN